MSEEPTKDELDAVLENLEEESVPDDTEEEITEEEAAKADIATPVSEPEEDHLTVLVCDCCLELNLTQKSVITCARCGKAFCLHFASNIDAEYCVNCMSDVSMTKSIITKSYISTNAETGQASFYRRKAREIQISGLDWLFAQRKIAEISDIELDLAIEYHRNILSLMIAEQEQRRTAKMHRYAGVRVHISTPGTTTVHDTTSTTVKKTRTVSKTKAQEQLAALLSLMKSKGMTVDKIAELLRKQEKK